MLDPGSGVMAHPALHKLCGIGETIGDASVGLGSDDDAPRRWRARIRPPKGPMEAFLVSAAVVALGEMGDKTQVTTVVLAARFASLAAVVIGTTLGMLLANAPVVLIGKAASAQIPFKAVRICAALLFAGLGVYALLAGEATAG